MSSAQVTLPLPKPSQKLGLSRVPPAMFLQVQKTKKAFYRIMRHRHLLMRRANGGGGGGGSAFTPNVSFQQFSQPTHQQTDGKNIPNFRLRLPLKMEKFPLDFLWRCRRGRRRRRRGKVRAARGNAEEHCLLLKMTRKSLEDPPSADGA